MSTAGQLIDTLLRRVRDLDAYAFGTPAETRAVLLGYISEGQRIVATGAQLLIAEGALTTTSGNGFYTLSTDFPAQSVIKIHDAGRQVRECDWRELARGDREWLVKQGSTIRIFASLGLDAFVLSPVPNALSDVSVIYTVLPTILTDESTTISLRPESEAAILACAEMLVHLRRRLFPYLLDALQRFIAEMTILGSEITIPPAESPNVTG